MLPKTARIKDLIIVTDKTHELYGLIGEIIEIGEDCVKVEIKNKTYVLPKESVKLRARRGTNRYDHLKKQLEESAKDPALTNEDLNDLIDLSLDLRMFEWTKELAERKWGSR